MSEQIEKHSTTAAGAVAPPAEEETVRPPVIERVIRPQDADPRRAKRSERIIALFFLLSALGTIGFIASYVAYHPSTSTGDAVSRRERPATRVPVTTISVPSGALASALDCGVGAACVASAVCAWAARLRTSAEAEAAASAIRERVVMTGTLFAMFWCGAAATAANPWRSFRLQQVAHILFSG